MKESGRISLVIGLGNPGAEFEHTYHNVGVLAVKYLAKTLPDGAGLKWENYKKLFSYLRMTTPYPIPYTLYPTFITPLTFMNESGLAAKEALKKFHVSPEDLIVIHDDSDLSIGDFKISHGQGSAGHKGVQSVIDYLGTQDFKRVRIGVRRTEEHGSWVMGHGQRKKAGDFVLNQISAKDREALEKVFWELQERL